MKKPDRKKKKKSGSGANPLTSPSVQIVFVDTDGKRTNGPLIEPCQKPIRKLNDADWNQIQTVERFHKYLQTGDSDGLDATVKALNRHNCWRAAIDGLVTGPSPNRPKGIALLSFWKTYGLHSIPRGMTEDLHCLIDAFKYLLPPYTGEGLTLYRGELDSRHKKGIYGISWTTIFKTAKMFADRRLPDEGRGVVLKIEAMSNMIVAAMKDYLPHTLKVEEDEYLIDSRMIKGKVSEEIIKQQ